MTDEPTYETIPNEFWPKCSCCGRDLGFETLELENPQGILRVCSVCREILFHEMKLHVPWIISQFLSMFAEDKNTLDKFVNSLYSEVKEFDVENMLKLAIQNMKKAILPPFFLILCQL